MCMFPNCCTVLWRAINLANNPDGKAQVNSLRTRLWKVVDSFNGEWDQWFKKIEMLLVQLMHLGKQINDSEFRDHFFTALRKSNDWKTWVEMQEAKPPVPGYLELKSLGLAKWTQLHNGNLHVLFGDAVNVSEKKEKVATILAREHVLKNCHNPDCPHDHDGLVWCSYHGKWTSHKREHCEMLKSDIAIRNS
eukprot:2886890-Rhodomonas_salina.1